MARSMKSSANLGVAVIKVLACDDLVKILPIRGGQTFTFLEVKNDTEKFGAGPMCCTWFHLVGSLHFLKKN